MPNRIILSDGTTIEDEGQYDETGLPETMEDIITVDPIPEVLTPVVDQIDEEV
jgi:hypothetical protein